MDFHRASMRLRQGSAKCICETCTMSAGCSGSKILAPPDIHASLINPTLLMKACIGPKHYSSTLLASVKR